MMNKIKQIQKDSLFYKAENVHYHLGHVFDPNNRRNIFFVALISVQNTNLLPFKELRADGRKHRMIRSVDHTQKHSLASGGGQCFSH